MEENNLDVVLSINNFHAGYAAAAYYPCLTVPLDMIKMKTIQSNLHFESFTENKLLEIGYAFEKETNFRKSI